jgi:hypothetical protein
MVAHLEIPRTQWTGKQAALRATEIRWSRGGARRERYVSKSGRVIGMKTFGGFCSA